MNHNLKLNDLAAATARRALDDIAAALTSLSDDDQRGEGPVMERCLRILPETLYNELSAYLGTIAQARWQLDQLIFWIDQADDEYGTELGRAILRHPSQGTQATIERALALAVAADVAMTDEEAAALIEPIDGHSWPRGEYVVPTGLEALISDLDRGLLTLREFQSEVERQRISQSHPCATEGCGNIVPFDDEPHCFTHSPDEGSSVTGYSWLNANYPRVPADFVG